VAGIGAAGDWELTDQKSAVSFFEDVSDEARRLGVGLVSVHPTQEIDKEKYKEVSMNLDLKGRYRDLGEYFKRLEGLHRLVNVRKIRIESCPDASSVCAAQVEAVTYMAK
jgi:type IV pilus assembly protein PilO